jgi:pimeloyl-ACP methyl ester carboxylesterase
VVLAGGLGTTLELWDAQMPALAPRFRVLRYDHPGHGGSPLLDDRSVAGLARAVVALLDDLELEQVSFCGLSLGGAVGMQLALDAPDRVDQACPLRDVGRASGRPSPGTFAWTRSGADGVAAVADIVLERWFTPAFRDGGRYARCWCRHRPRATSSAAEALREWDLRGALTGSARRRSPLRAATIRPRRGRSARDRRGYSRRAAGRDRARSSICSTSKRADEFNEAVLAHL